MVVNFKGYFTQKQGARAMAAKRHCRQGAGKA
jgi:hypothetical protein